MSRLPGNSSICSLTRRHRCRQVKGPRALRFICAGFEHISTISTHTHTHADTKTRLAGRMSDEYKSTKCGAPVRDNCIAVPARNNIVIVCGAGVRLLPRERARFDNIFESVQACADRQAARATSVILFIW